VVKKKEPLDPRMQALVDQALASGDPMGFINELAQQISGAITDPVFESNPQIELPDPPLHPSLLTLRVDIVGAHPPIWRRLELRGDLSLADVHEHLQAAFGWLNGHLHRFDAPGSSSRRAPYFLTEFDIDEGETGTDERDARLDQVLRKPGEKLRYTYDFGDNWEHEFRVESVRPATDDDPAALCTGGRGACPPEDVGGIHTWNELAAALRADPDPAHLTGELQMYADWLPIGCGPDEFTVAEANQSISLVGVDANE
jgi:Plasmid pRiA4b ORF-3-like protein.